MKYILIKIIKTYQKIPGPWHQCCRHIPTCSNYAIDAINEYGVIKGLIIASKRIIKCNPWGTKGIDLVPRKENKNEKIN